MLLNDLIQLACAIRELELYAEQLGAVQAAAHLNESIRRVEVDAGLHDGELSNQVLDALNAQIIKGQDIEKGQE